MSSPSNIIPLETRLRGGATADRHPQVNRGLAAPDFKRIAVGGFGDGGNSYAHCMAWFQNKIYVGTVRHLLSLLKSSQPKMPHFMTPWPVKYPGDIFTLDLRADIWCYDPITENWTRVHRSPIVTGPKGHEVPRDIGYRGMAVFKGKSDSAPALYVNSISSDSRGPGAHVLRSSDGITFEATSSPGLGDDSVSTFRSMVAFKDFLFISPTGKRQAWNIAGTPAVLASRDPANGVWEQASEPGFGDPNNSVVFDMAVFNDHLYAGTFNARQGFQVWKTRAEGRRLPFEWKKVVTHGAYRGVYNQAATSMCAFRDGLYVGGGIQNGGFDRTNRIGPAAAEVIRINPDDTWDIVCGTPRATPDGDKFPLSGRGPGFDNFFSGYMWRMAEHDGWLYMGTFDWSVFLLYANPPTMLPWVKHHVQRFGLRDIVSNEGGFDLWRTRDGANWCNVSRTGLGNAYNYGARTMVSTPYGLFLGTANPFGPDIAAETARGWTYIPNPLGGAEVWLGRSELTGSL